METKNELPEGFTCAECGRYAKFSVWLYAHWDMPAVHTCECGARHELLAGVATLIHPTTKGTKS